MKVYNITDSERAQLNELYLAYPDTKAVAKYNQRIEQLLAQGFTHLSAKPTDLLDGPQPLQTIDALQAIADAIAAEF